MGLSGRDEVVDNRLTCWLLNKRVATTHRVTIEVSASRQILFVSSKSIRVNYGRRHTELKTHRESSCSVQSEERTSVTVLGVRQTVWWGGAMALVLVLHFTNSPAATRGNKRGYASKRHHRQAHKATSLWRFVACLASLRGTFLHHSAGRIETGDT